MEGIDIAALAGAFVAAMGIPSAVCGLLVWWFKRKIDERDRQREEEQKARDKLREEREEKRERLMLMMMQTSRANNVLATATARAVQRIPDAQCNGDMHAALEEAARIQREEKDFIMDNGIKYIFGD